MKVLMWMPRGGTIPGGHVVQLEQTARALQSQGVQVRVSREDTPVLDDLDIVHGMGLSAREVEMCRRRGLPVVLSSIYSGMSYSSTGPGGGHRVKPRALAGRIRRAARLTRQSVQGREALARESMRILEPELGMITAYSAAEMLLPNAEGERENLIRDLGIETEIRVVPNAVDPALFHDGFDSPRPPRTVMMAGRVEPHKNQLGLIRALRDSDVEVVIVGPPHPHHPGYYRQCEAEAGANVRMLGGVPHEELPRLYRQARVHALPTFYETTGLVSLEAALSGCSIVTTSRGHAREYLGDHAWYCDPDDLESIRRAVRAALEAPASRDLADLIRSRYTWAHTARATYGAYQTVIDRRRGLNRRDQ